MAKSLEEILGPFEREPAVPGTRPGESDQVVYLGFEESELPADFAMEVIDRVKPFLPKKGGLVYDRCVITAPDRDAFYSLSFHGDLEGWRQQIQLGADQMGVLTARIVAQDFVISDGRSYPLASCHIELEVVRRSNTPIPPGS